jgi:hypothetical protein
MELGSFEEVDVVPSPRVRGVCERRHDGGGGRRVNDPSRSGILVCEECGERMVIDGPISVWFSDTISFGCECGEQLAPAERLERKRFGEAGSATNAASPTSPLYPW